MALRDPEPGERLAASVRAGEEHLVALLSGRAHRGGTVGPERARRLAVALRALFVGLGQGVVLGLAADADEEHWAEAARAPADGAPD
ncbi:hypothetical protein ACFQ9J_05040 [Streptomyces sp. NPDC056529]|uniref:hypothetical protein n=1 Tax=Streptomyces sp. NPDC056529 TaxID=3345855 RepID=UPI0036AC56AB